MYDACIVGGGHNGLVAATYLARAGRSVLVLERRDHVGGAAVSERPWPGVDARLSIYSYTPRPDGTGLLVRSGGAPSDAWRYFYSLTERVGQAVFPTFTEPLLA